MSFPISEMATTMNPSERNEQDKIYWGTLTSNRLLVRGCYILDELVNKLAGLGIAGLVLVVLVSTSSYAGAVAITTSLALLGGPFGMLGGITTLILLTSISSWIAKIGVEKLAEAVICKLLENDYSKSSLLEEIDNFPLISNGLRALLREYVSQYNVSSA